MQMHKLLASPNRPALSYQYGYNTADKFTEAIYLFHAFQKKSRKTSKDDIRLARNRYRAMLNERKTR